MAQVQDEKELCSASLRSERTPSYETLKETYACARAHTQQATKIVSKLPTMRLADLQPPLHVFLLSSIALARC